MIGCEADNIWVAAALGEGWPPAELKREHKIDGTVSLRKFSGVDHCVLQSAGLSIAMPFHPPADFDARDTLDAIDHAVEVLVAELQDAREVGGPIPRLVMMEATG